MEETIHTTTSILLNSSDRDFEMYPNVSNCSFQIEKMKNVVAINLVKMSIPLSEYNINCSNNTFIITIGSSVTEIIIPEQNYTNINILQFQIQSLLPSGITIIINEFVEFSGSCPFEIYLNMGIARILGFTEGTHTSDPSFKIKSCMPIKLILIPKMILCKVKANNSEYETLATVPLPTNNYDESSSIVYYYENNKNRKYENFPILYEKLTKLSWRIEDDTETLYNFYGVNLSMVLQIISLNKMLIQEI